MNQIYSRIAWTQLTYLRKKHVSIIGRILCATENNYLRSQMGDAIVPIIFATTGSWEPRSYAWDNTLIRETSATADTPAPLYEAVFFQRHAIRLLVSTAAALDVNDSDIAHDISSPDPSLSLSTTD